ncbi:MAG: 2-C-methyl-D-erythritol 4-phosphate cytidylyltransferase [Pirellulaceae bacterium]|nr:2-C-methyl-D-erythritol 4-phosphate cytidylyltransferase [Pirellulaceae bacterium]
MSKFSVILAAAGKSSRFRDKHYKKPFIRLDQKAVWLYSAERFLNRSDVCQLLLVIAPEDREEFHSLFGPNIAIMGVDVVEGGVERADSVGNALMKVSEDADFVVVHDAARPCLADEHIEAVFESAKAKGASILATPVTSTLKSGRDGKVVETISRADKWLAQTPQVYPKDVLIQAFENRGDFQPTDEAELLEQQGIPISLVEGSHLNIKITTKADLKLAKAILRSATPKKFDAPPHPFADGDLWR